MKPTLLLLAALALAGCASVSQHNAKAEADLAAGRAAAAQGRANALAAMEAVRDIKPSH